MSEQASLDQDLIRVLRTDEVVDTAKAFGVVVSRGERRRARRRIAVGGTAAVLALASIGIAIAVREPGSDRVRVAAPTTPVTTSVSARLPAPLLTRSPYGFVVPRGWTFTPLRSRDGGTSVARWIDPAARGQVVEYEVSSGELGGLYDKDNSINLGRALDAAGCSVASSRRLAGDSVSYTCVTASQDVVTRGVIVVWPFPGGLLRLQTTLAPSLDHTASTILDSLFKR